MKRLNLSTSGESHGVGLTGILSGFPCGLKIDEKRIEFELAERRKGPGRSSRQSLEKDEFEITGGVINGVSTGAPISIFLKNKTVYDLTDKKDAQTIPRPGHADYVGILKYNEVDMRIIAERASARRTAIDVALGAIGLMFLEEFEVKINSEILEIGGETETVKKDKKIKIAREKGESLGGVVRIKCNGLPPGLGSVYTDDLKLDGDVASMLMTIPGVKGIEIGEAIKQSRSFGTEVSDGFVKTQGTIKRENNFNGGLEGGMTTGEELNIKLYMKPVPTTIKEQSSLDYLELKKVSAPSPRADVCVLNSLTRIAQARLSLVLVDHLLYKFGGDSINEIKTAFNNYLKILEKEYKWKRT